MLDVTKLYWWCIPDVSHTQLCEEKKKYQQKYAEHVN